MAQPRRDDTTPAPAATARASVRQASGDYLPGGPVGLLHADLARQLLTADVVRSGLYDRPFGEPTGERMPRSVSAAAGSRRCWRAMQAWSF